jgi:hypothetical protein
MADGFFIGGCFPAFFFLPALFPPNFGSRFLGRDRAAVNSGVVGILFTQAL